MVPVLLYSVQYSFMWQYMAGAGAEIVDKCGAEKEPEPEINNFGSATLLNINTNL